MRIRVKIGVLLLMSSPAMAQLPGDRPAPNPHSTRSVVIARNGMIATSQPLASAAGLQVMQEGGNAIDAAITAAAVLAVVEPTMNGIGGDLFAIVHDGETRQLRALNASGRSPYAASPDVFASKSLESIPDSGILSISVPGVVDGWVELLKHHGTISLERALTPAINYARNGFPVSEVVAHQWEDSTQKLMRDPVAASTFLYNGRAPRTGEVFSNPTLARSLELIATEGRDAFYGGPLAEAIVETSRQQNGLFAMKDFLDHRSDWVDPISTNYRGYEVYEMPPNTQGITALQMLNLLEDYDLQTLGHNSAEYLHLVVEAKRIAFADRNAFIADPDSVPQAVLSTLLAKNYAALRRKEINLDYRADSYKPANLSDQIATAEGHQDLSGRDLGDTIYMTAADGDGNVISLIQSLFGNFGSGVVAGDTGIVLQNRGSLFSLKKEHPNLLSPHKRPFHTLVPAMVFSNNRPWLSFGVMGGDMQPQGHVQVLLNLIDFGMNIQEAGEAARIRHSPLGVLLESAITAEARWGLQQRGHRLRNSIGAFGGFQGILIDPTTGVLMGGSDPRKDGLAIGF